MRIKDDAKVEAIFKATLGLVKERGLAGITMCDISKAASIATGTLYIYFPSKEELIKTLFVECKQQSTVHYFSGVETLHVYEEKLKKVFTNITQYKIKFYEVAVFLEQSHHSPFVCIAELKKKQKELHPLFILIKEGIDKKILKEASVDLIISFMLGVINELVKKTYFSHKKLSMDTIEQLYEMFWDGVRV